MIEDSPPTLPAKSVVMIGLMGAGKTNIGRRVARRLGLPFIDADAEIVKAAGRSVADIFETLGEAAFRDGERKVIARLLDGDRQVLATGGGAFMNAETRAHIRERGISVWLRADLDLLVERTSRRDGRPLLKNRDIRATLAELMTERYPVYAQADIIVDTSSEPPETTADRVLTALAAFTDREGRRPEPPS
jgi:shikimate kinase